MRNDVMFEGDECIASLKCSPWQSKRAVEGCRRNHGLVEPERSTESSLQFEITVSGSLTDSEHSSERQEGHLA